MKRIKYECKCGSCGYTGKLPTVPEKCIVCEKSAFCALCTINGIVQCNQCLVIVHETAPPKGPDICSFCEERATRTCGVCNRFQCKKCKCKCNTCGKNNSSYCYYCTQPHYCKEHTKLHDFCIHRYYAILILHVMRKELRDVGKIIARVIWSQRWRR